MGNLAHQRPRLTRFTPYNPDIPNKPTFQIKMTNALTGNALLEMIRKMEDADRSTQCLTCGYVRENGKPAFTAFFEAILEARGVITNAQELKAENVDYQEQIDELLEDYDADAIAAFIELYGEENLESFSCLLYTSPSPRDATLSRMPSSA